MNTPFSSPDTDALTLSPTEAHTRIPGALLLDVRTPAEFQESHIEGALCQPVSELDPARIQQLASGKLACVLICQSGARAKQAAAKLKGCNLPGLSIINGGMQAWIAAGLPVKRGESHVLPLMRQVQIAVGSISAAGAALALLVNPRFAIIPLVTGCGLLFAGLTGYCGLAMLLARMPWNRSSASQPGSCCATK